MSGIIWANIGIHWWSRWIRKIVIWGFAIALIFIALILMVRFQNYSTELTAAAPNVNCANRTIAVESAWADFERVANLRNSDMHCYCDKVLKENGTVDGTYELFKAFNSTIPKDESPCFEWKFAYDNYFYLVIISGAMIGAINGVCVFIFEVIVIFEGCLTYMEMTLAQL